MKALIRPLVRTLEAHSPLARTAVGAYRASRLKANRPVHMKAPYRIQQIELTNKCPMKCPMCPRTESMTREEGLMSFATFKRIVDQAAEDIGRARSDNLILLHHFGESLMHPDFATFMNYGASKGLRFGLSANPIMLKDSVADKLLSARLDTLIVSLDGHDDETFEKARGVKNAYERSKQNLLRFLERKVETGWNTRIVFSIIDFALNKDSIAIARETFAGRPGLDEFLVKPFATFNGDTESVCALGTDGNSKHYDFVVCRHPWAMFAITWDGVVVPCCNDYDKKYPLGNVNDSTLMEIWNGRPMRLLREEFLGNKVTNSLCHKCPHLHNERD